MITIEDPPTLAIPKPGGDYDIMYRAQPYQLRYHVSPVPNLLLTGPRGTGKSLTIRMDSHMRAMVLPGFRYLTLRRTMKELKKSHLSYIGNEMERLGGVYNKTDAEAHYPNGSTGWFAHCESPSDIDKHLGGQYDLVNFDEATTFDKDMFLKIAATARVPPNSGRIALIRGGTNPLGVGADFVKRYFIDHDVEEELIEGDDIADEYNPADWGIIDTKMSDNKYIDEKDYRRRLARLPAHMRRAWINGEWVSEDMYFADFSPSRDGKPWHVIHEFPTYQGADGHWRSILDYSWVRVFRAFDWGYSPDPAVCLWALCMPNGRMIVFMEKDWTESLIPDIARQITSMTGHMRVGQTFADKTLFSIGKGATPYSFGDLFEQNGIALMPSENDRQKFGYAIHDYLNREVDDLPKLQILDRCGMWGCPKLLRTIPEMKTDRKDPTKIGPGNDHWVVCLAYLCMGQLQGSKDPKRSALPLYLQPRYRNGVPLSKNIMVDILMAKYGRN